MQNHLTLKSINFDTTSPTDVLKNLSGLSLCFLRIKYCLSVGETCGLPRTNIVRPYRVLGKYFVISPLILHALRSAPLILSLAEAAIFEYAFKLGMQIAIETLTAK